MCSRMAFGGQVLEGRHGSAHLGELDDGGADLAVGPVDDLAVRAAQNLAFGGPDRKTLFVVGRGVVFTVPMLATGFAGTRGK